LHTLAMQETTTMKKEIYTLEVFDLTTDTEITPKGFDNDYLDLSKAKKDRDILVERFKAPTHEILIRIYGGEYAGEDGYYAGGERVPLEDITIPAKR